MKSRCPRVGVSSWEPNIDPKRPLEKKNNDFEEASPPKDPQEHPRRAQEAPKRPPRAPKRSQRGSFFKDSVPRSPQDNPQEHPRGAQEDPRPKEALEIPRCSQEDLRIEDADFSQIELPPT